MKGIAFKDRVFAHVSAGDGGDGCCSFRREKYVDMGGPDGGDGGHGGSVYVEASKDVDSLVSLYYQPQQRAPAGGRGKGAQRTGETGRDLVIPVPCGTQVWEAVQPADAGAEADGEDGGTAQFIDFEAEAAEEDPRRPGVFGAERRSVGEVLRHGDRLLVAKGGRGGKGNMHFATSSHQAPREFTTGTKGEVRTLVLELKTVADVGLVGYPNAGKSTLLSRLTNAHPKIAPYPFTTVNPLIGTLVFDDHSSLRVADIPGLIDGAHNGTGLGFEFLRHIERSAFLLFLIDMAAVDGRDPVDDYRSLRRELKLYQPDLLERPSLVLANKMDLPGAAENLKKFRQRTRTKPLPVAAGTGEGVEKVRDALYEWKKGLRCFDGD